MDKTLEIIMVAVGLLVALVIVTALFQSQVSSVGNQTQSQTNTATCGIAKTNYCNAHNGTRTESKRANGIRTRNEDCNWAANGNPGSIC
jgi:hypothetical protein